MKAFFSIFMLFFSALCFAQQGMDTIHVYDGLDISYMYREDTVLMSQRKWNSVVEIVKIHHDDVLRCVDLNTKYSLMASLSDSTAKEAIAVSRVYEEMSVMYRGMYDYSVEQVIKLNGLLKESDVRNERERKRQWARGATVGVAGGLVVGIITAAILLK